MCGKFTQMMSWSEVHSLSELTSISTRGDAEEFTTPMRFAHIVRLGADGRRETVRMRWGFMALDAKTPIDRPRHMHAKAETVDRLPTFRDAFARARGLAIVRTFNEGEEVSPRKTIQYTITPNDGKPIGIAVIWERWTHRTEGELLTFCMVTTEANKLISRVTNRMPAVIPPEHWGTWLGETDASLEEIKSLLVPYEGDWRMKKQRPSKPPKRHARDGQPDLFGR